jgi:hypothetical protein
MHKNHLLYFLVAVVILWGCGPVQTSKTTNNNKEAYSEDITAFRAQPKKYEVEVDTTQHFVETDSTSLPVTDRLNTVLDTAAAYNRANIKYIDGFTIQVYGGNNRSTAKNYQLDIIRNFPDVESKMVFEQPNYKVRIGQYYTRLEAQEFFIEVKSVFSRAILIPTRIYVNK